MRGGQDAAHHLHRRRREAQAQPAAELLQHLGLVPVAGGLVGAHAARSFRVVACGARLVAALAGARLHLHDGLLDHARGHQRAQRQDGRRRVAAAAGDQRRLRQPIAVQLGHPVHGVGQQFRPRVRASVPADVGRRFAQAKVGAEIDDALGQSAEPVDPVHRAPVREAQEQHVARSQLGGRHEFQIRDAAQVGMSVADVLAGQPLGGGLFHRYARMEEQQPQQLPSGVAGGADDGGADHRAAWPMV